MTAHPIPGLPGLFVSPLLVLARVPESATRLVVGADPADPGRHDAAELAARYAEWVARWKPVAQARRRGKG